MSLDRLTAYRFASTVADTGVGVPVAAAGDPLSPPSHPLGTSGLTAIAIYDYQKQDDDEISFEPDDIITNIDQVGLDHA
ncbi:unnamed protein product [Anisakis simplex]|uniref:Putative cortactin (inferred by orthology to a S. mansoni protein) n=1 Tax=Anisakis simplex TaxID=6269 RepID=A0A0M3JGS8_ANISI|nr:unnamed protein product [Anisakis simplex]